MDFRFSEAEEAYRAEVRAWLERNIPDWWQGADRRDDANTSSSFERLRGWHQTLYDAGYLGSIWPAEYGGQGRTQVENAILQEEFVRMKAPPTVNGLGIGLAGPAIIRLFTVLPEVRAVAVDLLPWVVVSPLVSVWSFLLDGIFIGATRTGAMRNAMALSVLAYLAACALLIPALGNDGLWLAFMIFMAARAVSLGAAYPRLERAVTAPAR